MQKDSVYASTSGRVTHNPAVPQESPNESFQCSHCTLIFKSKVYLFEHLNKVHGFDVDVALRGAGLEIPGTDKDSTDNNHNSPGNDFECQLCDFKSCSWDLLHKHEAQCHMRSENQNVIGDLIRSENLETSIHSQNEHKEGAGAKEISSSSLVMPTSKTQCKPNSSKDLKTYKRPLQTITQYFEASSASKGNPPLKVADSSVLLDSSKGTLILQESPSDSSTNTSGVFKVTAKPMIDLSRVSTRFLLDDHLLGDDLTPPKPKKQFKETVPNKKTNNESSTGPPAKKAKSGREETKGKGESASKSKQQLLSSADFLFECSEDEEEKKVNGNTKSPNVYFCKHCDYSDVSIRCMTAHYQNVHPYIRYNTVYIQEPSDQSATFRCLECPVEFLSVADLKRHYTENHPEAPDVFTMLSRDLRLVFKCFVCPFTITALKALKEHYKEKHPTHEVDNSLMYCRYSAARYQEGPSQLNTSEKVPSPERPRRISHDSAYTSCKEVKNAPSPQHPSSKGADMTLYHCNKCKYSHKSVVAMHVHYQKSHPDEVVTIDKIKQSAHDTSYTTSQMTPDKSPNSVAAIEKATPQKNISDSSEETRTTAVPSQQRKISLSLRNPKYTPEASTSHSESPNAKKVEFAEDRSKEMKPPTKRNREMSAYSLSCTSEDKLFYCQFCSYSSTNIRSVVGHHNAKHSAYALIGIEGILSYSAKVHKEKLQSEAEATTSSDSQTSKQVKKCSEKELEHEEDKAARAPVKAFNAYACAENLFYCRECNYGNPTVKGVLTHHAKIHQSLNTTRECIIEHTALVRDEIEKSKSQAKELSFSTNLPLPLMNDGNEDVFFCHFCNYRQSTVDQILRHYFKKHRGFVVKREQIRLYTSMILKKIQTLRLKTTANQEGNRASLEKKENEKETTKKLGSVPASPSVRALQTQRIHKCYRCSYSTQYVYLLKRHIWKIHKSHRSVTDVLRLCYKQGTLQTGYHCDLCVFSDKKAAAVYQHYQEQHPSRRPSLEYVTTHLCVSPEMCPPKKKRPQKKHTDSVTDTDSITDSDGSLPSQRSGKNETKMYSCRACSFKGSSMSSLTHHYRAVHPWSVKDDGSVLDVISSKKPSANRQVEDHDETPVSFDTYQMPLEFDNSPGSPEEATESPTVHKCPHCSVTFTTQRGLNTHCGIKHQGAENSYDQQEEQVQILKRVHVFKCPHCTYVNTNYSGVITHCQMKHPALACRAESSYVTEAQLHNWANSSKRKDPGLKFRGYMCQTCPKICATLEKLEKHCEKGHNGIVANAVPNAPKSAPNPSAVSKIKQYMTHSNQGSVSKASFLSMKKYAVIKCQYCAYSCSTKLALGRHLRVHHKNASISKAQDCLYKCALCSSYYFTKKCLGSHYAKKHGKESFFKYYAALHKQVQKKPAPTVPDHPLTQPLENTSEPCKSSATEGENKILAYRCPNCPYVNASYHGTLTHCQMKHPDLIARADELQTEEILITNMVNCTKGKGSNERGYMCKKCPQIHVSLKRLKIHCERDHDLAEVTASDRSAETEAEKQPDHDSALEAASLISETSAVSATEIGLSHQLATPETCQSNTPSVKNKESLYRCRICAYIGSCRKYLYCHYKKTHKLDAFTTYKLLERYNKYRRSKASSLPEAESEASVNITCKVCPNLKFDSPQLLIAHYSTFHSSDFILDFIVLSQASKKSTGLYKCAVCKKQMNGIRKLCHHLDCHRERQRRVAKAAQGGSSPEAQTADLSRQDELPTSETVEELDRCNVKPAETSTSPPSPLSSPSKPTDPEQAELESREERRTCKQCGRMFMSLKGLRSHERSHAALAAIKKLDNLPTSALKRDINKYILYKTGTLRPFRCSCCSYRTTVFGLWRSHFMKNHQDLIMDSADTDNQDVESIQRADKEPSNSSEALNISPELNEEPETAGELLYSEPPDVQRQLNHYTLMAQAGAPSKANMQESSLPDNSLLDCEICSFNTGHLSSMRRHYLNRHGKKMLRCKDCDFFTSSRKTLEKHTETAHSTCQSEPTHQKNLRCPLCLYQTKNKNNMIDHIVLHREERVVPIEVRRPKLSHYLRGIVFRCHNCTFTSGTVENLRLHMMKHEDIKPYKCRLCYFDCTQLSDLEAHLSDKHQVVRNHELVGQVSLDQLEARVCRMQKEFNLESHNNEIKTEQCVADSDEAPLETHAKNPTEKIRENITLQIKESYQKQGQDGKNGNEESLQHENIKPNTTAQEGHEQDPQAGTVFLPDAARRQGTENTVEQNVGEGNNADIQFEDSNCPQKDGQTNEERAHPKLREREDSSVAIAQQKEEAAGGSSTRCVKVTEKAQAHKMHIKALKHRALNIEARVENDILRHILLLDKDGSVRKKHKRAEQDRRVKTEHDIESEDADNVQNEILLANEKGNSQKNQVHTEAISSPAKKNYGHANNIRAQERFTVERHLLTLKPNYGLLKISHKEILGVSFTNCKEEEVQNEEGTEEVKDLYGEMPVLENEYLKEETHPLGCCKEEDQNDGLGQKQDKEDEAIVTDDENQKHQGADGIKEAENPLVPKGGAATQEKLFTCEFCGRNLRNSSELERHVIRHGL